MKSGANIFQPRVLAGILVMVLAASVPVLIGGCGQEAEEDRTDKTVTVFQPVVAPSDAGAPSVSPNGTPSESEDVAPDGNSDNGAAGELPEVVSSKDVVGPCVDGVQQVTHSTTYSDGTMASSISTQPCEEEEPPIVPVPAN